MKTPMTKLMLAAAAATLLCLGTRAEFTLDDGLVAYYKFDGDIADSSGNGYDWTGTAATWTTDRGGEENRAALFSGSGTLTPNDLFGEVVISNSLTIAVWVKPSGTLPADLGDFTEEEGHQLYYSGTEVLYPSHGGYTTYAGVGLYVGTNGIAVARLRDCLNPPTLLWYNAVGENWIHVAITISDNGGPVLYVNGVHVATGIQLGTGEINFIGKNFYYPSDSAYSTFIGKFRGALDEMRFYDRALGAEEVAKFMGTKTITWLNDDSSEIDTTEVEYGLMPEHADATKASDADFDYFFAGWSPELAEVESNTTYTVVFLQIPRVHSTGGDAEWSMDAEEGALRSGAIGNSGNTWFRTSVPRPCVFTFKWKASSEYDHDKLGFTINGADAYDTAGNKIEPISGERDWATVSVVVSNSLDVLEWKYGKDSSTASGQDCGWIRNFTMAPFEGEVRTLSVVPNHDGAATVNAYAEKDCVMGVFPTVARYGYKFLGLFTAAEGGDLVEPPYALSADTTLYAHWAKTSDFDTSDPNAPWTIEDDGITWRTGTIGDSTNTWATYTVKRPCTVTFKWKASTEGDRDPLVFYVDGEERSRICGEMENWADISLTFEDSKNHVLKWEYSKDTDAAGTYDCGWIRDFVLTPLDSYEITLAANFEGGGAFESRYVKKGRQLSVGEIPVPLRTGYVFTGWTLTPEDGEKLTGSFDITADTTLYAHWAEAFDITSTGGDGEWSTEADGITWRSGEIGDSQKTWMRVVTKRPGVVSFKWKTSSESSDILYLKVDGKDVDGIGAISGVMADWAEVTLPAFEDSGNHIIEWTYKKDGSSSVGEDCAWVTDFLLEPLDSWVVTCDLNYDGAGEFGPRYVKKGRQLDVSEFPPMDEPRAGYTCWWALSPWTGDVLTNAVDISADTTLYAHWVKQYGFKEFDETCQEAWRWLDDGSIRTGMIGDQGETWATISVTGPCDVSFKWKTSSESNWDKLHFYVDGSEKRVISGEMTEWESYQYPESIAEGDHVLKWTYTKDGSGASGEDCGWIKDIVITAPESAPYTVTWQNADGTTLETDADLEAGAVPAYNSALPVKAADAQYYYDFAGWEPDFELVSSNTTYTAVYTATLRSYDVTWLDEDGTQLATETLFYGETPECEAPTKEATAQYTYTFAGWMPEVTTVTGDATYTATYNATINKYTVTWKDDDGTTLGTDTVAYGSTPSRADPAKAATAQYTYAFTGWSPAVAEVTGDATYTATYSRTVNTYTITWKDDNGATLRADTLEYGATPSYGGSPSKADDTYNTYTFLEWTPAVASVTGNATYTATYTAHPKWSGSGTNAEPYTLTTPERITEILALDGGSSSEIFVQTGGDVTAESITANLPTGYAVRTTGTAGVVKVVQTVTVVWYDEDGETVLERDEDVDIGSMPSFDGATPTKAATAQYTYEFNGWTPTVVAVTESASYTATYTETLRSYTITWLDADGSQIGTSTVAYGGTPTHAAPASTYTFTGWSPAIATVTGDATYTATFSHEVQLANLTGDYTAADGDVLTGTTAHNVTIPGGATVTVNGIAITGAGGGSSTPEPPTFDANAEAVTTKFEKGVDGKWRIVAFAELATGTAAGVDDMITILRGDEPNAVVTPVTPESLCTTNAVKVEAVVTPPAGKDKQFFKVKFGE